MASSNKKKILLGVLFIGIALLFLIGVVYLMVKSQQASAKKILALQEQLSVLKTEKETGKQKIVELEQALGKSIRLENVLQEAKQKYDVYKEKEHHEGYLWIEHENQPWVITLGALNGVGIGSRLTVYDGETKIGMIKVQTPLDSISYVQPVDKSVEELKAGSYRVVLEK